MSPVVGGRSFMHDPSRTPTPLRGKKPCRRCQRETKQGVLLGRAGLCSSCDREVGRPVRVPETCGRCGERMFSSERADLYCAACEPGVEGAG